MNPAQLSRDVQLFVVHVWRQRMRFRASVRRVDNDDTRLFTTPARLARYLATVGTGPEAEAARAPPPAPAPATPSARPEGADTP